MAYSYDGREFDFSPIPVADILKAKNALMAMGLAKNIDETIQANGVLDLLAFKYVKVKGEDGKWVEKLDTDTITLFFKDESAFIEISLAFIGKVRGFLEKSPSFQALQNQA